MNANELSNIFILKSTDEIIDYITENRNAIRYMFLTLQPDISSTEHLSRILLALSMKELSDVQMNSIQIQSMYVHLAYYFRNANKEEFLDTCHSNITERYFKIRLDAWIKFKRYHTYDEHLEQFENYINLLSMALAEIDDGNSNEVLQDLKDYQDYAMSHLSNDTKTKLSQLFSNEELHEKYPLLRQFCQNEADEILDLKITEYDNYEYTPSDFVNQIFNEKFLNNIKEKSYPDYPHKLFGFPSSEIRYDIIQQGQADYDQKYKNLSPKDITDLYCYYNMRMHYYSSLSLFERSQIEENYYNTSGRIKFVDIGCGPGTSGLAFINYIYQKTGQKVAFDYYGIDSSKTMQNKAFEILTNDVFSDENSIIFASKITEIEKPIYKNANCIIINCCFVFASKTLPIEEIAEYINDLIGQYPYIPKYLLYQNSIKKELNETYLKFKDLLKSYSSELETIEEIRYHNVQLPYYEAKKVTGIFESLKLG